MKFNLSSLGKLSTPWLLGLSLIACSINEGRAEKPARPKPCASKMAQKATNRVLAEDLNIGQSNKTWTMVAGEVMLNMKDPDGKSPAYTARIDVKVNEGDTEEPFLAALGCSTFPKAEAFDEWPLQFGVTSFSDKSGDVTHLALGVVFLNNKWARIDPYPTNPIPAGLLSMVKMLKDKSSGHPDVVIKSREIFKISDREIVVRSVSTQDEVEEMDVTSVQKFILR